MRGLILPASIVNTGGHPSYPATTRNLGLDHKIVNHTEGFCASDGAHTNNVGKFLVTYKKLNEKEHGVTRSSIDEWLI